jgi:hypothetical protein
MKLLECISVPVRRQGVARPGRELAEREKKYRSGTV